MQTHATCPKCGSRDAVTWFEKGRGYCHGGCGGKAIFTEEYVPLENREVASATFEGIRGIHPEIAKMYGIQIQMDKEGKPIRYAFKYPSNTKYRGYETKTFWHKERGIPNHDLFGPDFNAGTSKRIYLTEGEFDAASLFQVIGRSWPVKSLPSAGVGEKFLAKNKEYLDSFSEIVWAGDNDDAGRKACSKFYEAFPEKLYKVHITKWKDANEALVKGDVDELKWAALKPVRYTPENFFVSDDDFEKIIKDEEPYQYVPTPCEGLNDVVKGFVKGGMTLIMAPPGAGKTDLLRYFQYHLLKRKSEENDKDSGPSHGGDQINHSQGSGNV